MYLGYNTLLCWPFLSTKSLSWQHPHLNNFKLLQIYLSLSLPRSHFDIFLYSQHLSAWYILYWYQVFHWGPGTPGNLSSLVRTVSPTDLIILRKVFLLKKFSSKSFAHLQKTVALLLKMLMKPMIDIVRNSIFSYSHSRGSVKSASIYQMINTESKRVINQYGYRA